MAVQQGRVNYADPLQNIPVTLSENGMYLAANGMPTSNAVNMDLADNYLPDYADTTTY